MLDFLSIGSNFFEIGLQLFELEFRVARPAIGAIFGNSMSRFLTDILNNFRTFYSS